jgi:hypothetical protein
MLTQSRVLDYIRTNLGVPFTFCELSDEQILEYVINFTRHEWSAYFPQKKRIPLDLATAIGPPNIQNEFYLEEPDGLEILNVVNVYFPSANLLVHGHQPLGPLSHGDIREWALSTTMAMDLKQFSSFDYTFEFTHPNLLRISPIPTIGNSIVTVEYERIQPEDLSGIPNEFQILFSEMALADIMIYLGRIRKKYADGNLTTPFGTIPINAEIFDEGKEKKREIIDKLTAGSMMNVIIAVG